MYPTISNGEFTLQAKKDLGKATYRIFDMAGRQVYASTINFTESSKQEVSVNLTAGTYIINLIDQNNRKSSSKLIIR